MLGPILPDGRIRYVNVQLEKLRLDAPTTPSRVRLPHASDEPNELAVGGRTAAFPLGLAAPEEPESQAMPLQDGLGLNEEQGFPPVVEHGAQGQPKQAIGHFKLGLRSGALQNRQLVTECEIFEDQLRTTAKGRKQNPEEGGKEFAHG